MLGYLFEKTTALVSSTVDGILAVGEYVIDDITSIPQAIEDGWDKGLIDLNTDKETSIDTTEEVTTDVKTSSESK